MKEMKLNTAKVRWWMRGQGRNHQWLMKELRVGQTVLSKMLNKAYIPQRDGDLIVAKLADLMGVDIDQLLLPKDDEELKESA